MATTAPELSKNAARVGGILIGIGILLSLLLLTPWISPLVKTNSTFLLFVSQALACVSGVMVLQANLRRQVRYATIGIASLIGLFLLVCFGMAVGGTTSTVQLIGQEWGVTISEVVFFMFAAGMDDILNSIRTWTQGVAGFAWIGNIIAMTVVVLAWTLSHILKSDAILTNAFMVAYVSLSMTKYSSLSIVSSSKAVRWILGFFAAVAVVLGWLYIIALTRPDLLPGWILNATLFAAAIEFGVSYGVDAILRGKEKTPWFEFISAIGLQAVFMTAVGIIGAFLPAGAPLITGLLCMETLPNLPIGIAFVSEAFRKMRQRNSYKLALGYNLAFGIVLCILIALCSTAILKQDYGVVAGGTTISLLQAAPWMLLAQWSCLIWAQRPGRALFALTTALIVASAICVGIAIYLAQRGGYSETDLVALWYSIARVPSAIGLGCFGFLGVALVGSQAPKEWRYLLLVCNGAVGIGIVWFILAVFTGGIGAAIAPGFILQVAGGVNVALCYTAFNSTAFRTKASEALAAKLSSTAAEEALAVAQQGRTQLATQSLPTPLTASEVKEAVKQTIVAELGKLRQDLEPLAFLGDIQAAINAVGQVLRRIEPRLLDTPRDRTTPATSPVRVGQSLDVLTKAVLALGDRLGAVEQTLKGEGSSGKVDDTSTSGTDVLDEVRTHFEALQRLQRTSPSLAVAVEAVHVLDGARKTLSRLNDETAAAMQRFALAGGNAQQVPGLLLPADRSALIEQIELLNAAIEAQARSRQVIEDTHPIGIQQMHARNMKIDAWMRQQQKIELAQKELQTSLVAVWQEVDVFVSILEMQLLQ